jgi:surfactin synthase thioesterase subunit
MTLFCFPFAGGSKYSYNHFIPFAAKGLNIVPLELPGRGARRRETLTANMNGAVTDIYNTIRSDLSTPYAFYGHSMGAVLAYLVVKRIISDKLPSPVYIFVSGREGPSIPNTDKLRHLMPREQFIAELREIGGSPDELLNDDDLMDFFEPVLRADFAAMELYEYEETYPFNIPILAMIGLDEKILEEEVQAWQKETIQEIEIKRFEGKHFFIFTHPEEIMSLINARLLLSVD